METIDQVCIECGNEFTLRPQDQWCQCPDCAKKHRIDDWKEICPPLYQNTDPEREGFPKETVAKMTEFALANLKSGIGIGVIGEPGTCKTRSVHLVLRHLFVESRQSS